MAAIPCPYCGAPVAAGAAFCGRCGRSLAAVPPPAAPLFPTFPATPLGPPYAPPGYAPPGYVPPAYPAPGAATPGAYRAYPAYPAYLGSTGGPAPPSAGVDGPVLSDIFAAGAILLVGVLLSLVAPNLIGTGLGPAVSLSPTGSAGLGAGAITDLLIVLVVGLALTILAYIKFRQAFARLRVVDDQFRMPATFSLLAVIGLIIVLPVVAALLEVLTSFVNCAGSSGVVPQSCINSAGALLGLVGLLLVAGIIALIGYIGTLVGVWRFGNRYNETMFKVGAVLLIFPYLNAIGAILLMVAAHGAKGRLGGPAGALSTPAPYRPM